jgi:hypothetical protein
MEKAIKYKIRHIWRDRLLISISSLIVLGFSAVQLEAVLENRPSQPAWVLELSQAVRVLTNDKKDNQEKIHAISELQRISQAHDLQITMLLQHLRWKNLEQQVDQVQNWKHDQALARAHTRELVLKRVQALELAQERQSSRDRRKTQQLAIKLRFRTMLSKTPITAKKYISLGNSKAIHT